uniref:Tryptophan synthase beta chain-like PALP domain-containing protein n=1 Tax=Dunaliella tertiolecta TaxID=3047 RepID=A0A7S3QMP8_DUNTE|mmetsp:Transcript_20779/g.57933  ORF Transcript_20779/g.57933 Transcript_20779/m.57933 type:complete len:378 (+) Transcript_20779:160-1293(+)|eukprot:CAMPEP_0202348302 /NCGR_PEP_ID=MMETSP1126-20121109/6291_1 /ASSEMBLY_ACC=CAM_ASM_000457 /TAXON_ID=3047 /ORGANISM="Dunaliella tertiolecta, Strain CCMP1320" /LENGTH=377 /DNA_ID=CAMNT_0048939971 /DNA_START=97 /DNA_END=1230 /DNA_ORIENTATION=+
MTPVEAQKSSQKDYAASFQDIQCAAERIAPHIHITPVWQNATLDKLAGQQLFFKCEMLQKTGAFKYRGACNAIFSLPEDVASNGVATHSSGNHAAAIARAAQARSIPAFIVLPSNTPQCKIDAVKAYGGVITMCPPGMDAREAACKRVIDETGATFVPPYNHPHVIAGQGTIALEMLQQVPDLDAIVVPVSGGGMISGISICCNHLARSAQQQLDPQQQPQQPPSSPLVRCKPGLKVIAAEPVGRQGTAADVALSKATGQIQLACERPDTIADGLMGRLGDLTWPCVRDLVSGVLTVSEAEIVNAMQHVYERMKLVVEPSGAVGLAAVLSPAWGEMCAQGGLLDGCKKVGVILCGGNVDLAALGLWDSLRKSSGDIQ